MRKNFPKATYHMQLLTLESCEKSQSYGTETPLEPNMTTGRKKWSPEEEDKLKRIFSDPLNKMGIQDIAHLLGRSAKSIERRKEKMLLGSARQLGRKPKPHLIYPERIPGSSLHLIPAFNLLEEKKKTPSTQLFLDFLKGTPSPSPSKPTQEIPAPSPEKKDRSSTPWTIWDLRCLEHYWNLRALGINDVAIFLRRTPEEVIQKAQELKYPEKPRETPTNKYQISRTWHIELDTVTSQLSNDEQHALAELTATRLSHLKTNPEGSTGNEKEATREINNLFQVQRHIFYRAIRSKAKKFARLFHDSATKEEELIQVGETTLYDVVSRWNPADGINFCRATVAQSIERQMQHWLRSSRLVKLPSALISEIVEERKRSQSPAPEEEETPQKEKTAQRKASIARYYHTIHPDQAVVTLNEQYEENDEFRVDQLTCGQETNSAYKPIVEPEHQSFHMPTIERDDVRDLLATVCSDLPEQEKYAFCQYNGIGEDGEAIPQKNLRELANECGVSPERIRQRINLARQKLVKKLARAGIRCSGDAL